MRWLADEVAVISGGQLVKILKQVGYEFDVQHGSHMIIRNVSPPNRRLSVPNHHELAKGTLRALIREAGLTMDEFLDLL